MQIQTPLPRNLSPHCLRRPHFPASFNLQLSQPAQTTISFYQQELLPTLAPSTTCYYHFQLPLSSDPRRHGIFQEVYTGKVFKDLILPQSVEVSMNARSQQNSVNDGEIQ